MSRDATGHEHKGKGPGGGQFTSSGGGTSTNDTTDHAEDYRKNGTRAKAFKAWFGDWEHDAANASKVVNKDGEPQETHRIEGSGSKVMKDGKPVAVYHGTSHGGFEAFDKSKVSTSNLYGPGFYFTEDQEVANTYTAKDAAEISMVRIHQAQMIEARLEATLPDGWLLRTRSTNADEHAGQTRLVDPAGYEHPLFVRDGKTASIRGEDAYDHLPSSFGWDKDTTDSWREMLKNNGVEWQQPEVKGVYLNIRKPFDIDKDALDASKLSRESLGLVRSASLEERIAGNRRSLQSRINQLKNDFVPMTQKNLAKFEKRLIDKGADPNSTPADFFSWHPKLRNSIKDTASVLRNRLGAYQDSQGRRAGGSNRDIYADVSDEELVQHLLSTGRLAFEEIQSEDLYESQVDPEVADDYLNWQAAKSKMAEHNAELAQYERKLAAPTFSYEDLGGGIGLNRSEINELLQKIGYDGLTHIGGKVTGGKDHRVWIAFEPNQIKSVQNKGTFDPASDNINLSLGTPISEHQRAADALTAQVIKRAEAGGKAVSSEVQRETLALMRKLVNSGITPRQLLEKFLTDFRSILRKYEPVMARTISDAQVAGWLQGGQGVLSTLPPVAKTPNPFDAAFVDSLLTKPEKLPSWLMSGGAKPIVRFPIIHEAAKEMAIRGVLTPSYFESTIGKARLEGLSMARISSLDALEKMRNALVDAVVDGDTVETFMDKAADALGKSRMAEKRQRMLFRNHVNMAYQLGQKAVVQSPLVRSSAVFAFRSEIDDSRLTDLCRALSRSGLVGRGGKRTSVFCVLDPVWARVAPSSHMGCRCSTIFWPIKRAAEKGIEAAIKWLETGIRPPDDELFVPTPDLSDVPEKERLAFSTWESPWQASVSLSIGFDPNEARDDKGQWTKGGATGKSNGMKKKHPSKCEPWELTAEQFNDKKVRSLKRDVHFILEPSRHGKTAEEVADAIEKDGFTRGMSSDARFMAQSYGLEGAIGFLIDQKDSKSKGRGPEILPGTKPLLRIKMEKGDTMHKAIVRAALIAGHDVPPEVLAEYHFSGNFCRNRQEAC